jgi:hypothetical protein
MRRVKKSSIMVHCHNPRNIEMHKWGISISVSLTYGPNLACHCQVGCYFQLIYVPDVTEQTFSIIIHRESYLI